MRLLFIPTALLLLGGFLACGGGGGSTPTPPPASGTLTLRLGSDSLPGYSQVWVSVEKVEGSRDGSSWALLSTVKQSFDLMALQNGRSEVILPATTVAPGTFTQFRLTWAAVNYQSAGRQPAYLVLGNGTELLLAMPATKTTLVKGPVTVVANGTTTAQLMLSGQQAVQTRPGPTYTFQATGIACDLAASAKITGRLLDTTNPALPQPLGNAEVLVETVDGLDVASIQRRAVTDASGNYVLEGLPAGAGLTTFVVAQPVSISATYGAKALKVLTPNPTTYPADFSFSGPRAPGALTVTVTPASSAAQTTWAELRQTLATGASESHNLVVQSQPAASSLAQDQIYFTSLYPTSYGVTVQRSTDGAAPVRKVGGTYTVDTSSSIQAFVSYP